MITIVDYGMGNLGSIANMLRRISVAAEVTADPEVVRRATRLILPGVGAFDAGMRSLSERGLIPALIEAARERGVPTLGICLGLQLFSRRSTEGSREGLGWLDAETVRFRPDDPSLRVPHMGWNAVTVARSNPLLPVGDGHARFYFVHSYHLACMAPGDVVGTSEYGYAFPAVVGRDNLWGTQFHPEKSHRYGMELLAAFARLASPAN